MYVKQSLRLFIFCFAIVIPSIAQQIATPNPQSGSITGTVTDANDDIVSGATVVLDGPTPSDQRTVISDNNGFFEFRDLKPGVPYHVTISGNGLVDWTSPFVILNSGQYFLFTGTRLRLSGGVTSVTVYASPDQIAVAQVKVEEQQRVFGIIPNFYVVYDPNPAALTAKLNFSLALKTSVAPVTFVGVAFLAGINQAADTLNYILGAKGYGQRFGAVYADGFTDIIFGFGGAILPSLLHLDPRYYYQGTALKSHALSTHLPAHSSAGEITVGGGELFHRRWRSDRGFRLQCLLSNIESWRWAGLYECRYRHR